MQTKHDKIKIDDKYTLEILIKKSKEGTPFDYRLYWFDSSRHLKFRTYPGNAFPKITDMLEYLRIRIAAKELADL